MVDELMDVVDEVSGKPTGQKEMKSKIYQEGLWHLASQVWIYNSKGEFLFQKRSFTKDMLPGLWDIAVAGHVDTGETPKMTALREVKEEIGVDATNNLEELLVSKNSRVDPENKINNVFYHAFTYKFDGNVNDLVLQKEEVEEIKFFSIKEVKEKLLVDREISCLPLYAYSKEAIELIEKKFL